MRFLLLIVFVTWHVTDFNVVGTEELEGLHAVTDSANKFSTKFFSTVARSQSGNLICSPLSAFIVLSMCYYGAGGNTKRELRTVLELSENDELALKGYQELVDGTHRYTNVNLRVASKMFLADNFAPKTEFTSIIDTTFRSKVQRVNFDRPDEASNTINQWAEAETNHLVKEIIRPDDIDSMTVLVLANAVYFKGEWENKFDAAQTKMRPFHINHNEEKNVETMYRHGSYEYGQLPELKAKFVKLPYKKGESSLQDISMFIILPNEIDGLAELEKQLNNIRLDIFNSEFWDVHLYLPKVKIESEIDLKAPLMEMGLNDTFLDTANFNGITENVPIKVTKILQKAFIEINEEGSEAAAVTSMQIAMRRLDPEVTFNANHPFMSMIVTQGRNPMILFIGSYTGIESTKEKINKFSKYTLHYRQFRALYKLKYSLYG